MGGDPAGDRLWSRVAVEIAKRAGREIGSKAADRFEAEATREGRALARRRAELTPATHSVLAGLGEIARDRDIQTELHNVSARVRNAGSLVVPDAVLAAAGVALVRAATELAAAAERSSGLIGQGLYPPELQAAGAAAERWRAALLTAARR